MKARVFALFFFGIFAVPAGAQDNRAPDTALCDGIAAQLRANDDLVSGTLPPGEHYLSPLKVLTEGKNPYIAWGDIVDAQDVRSTDWDSVVPAFKKRLAKKFRFTPELAGALDDTMIAAATFDLHSVHGNTVHLLHANDGSRLRNQFFLFFDAPKGKAARLLELPPSLGGDISEDDEGGLARTNMSSPSPHILTVGTNLILPTSATIWTLRAFRAAAGA